MLTEGTVVVGRQGIHAPDGLMGYELLFRTPGPPQGIRPDGDQMTAEVVFGAMSIGLGALVGEHTVFCNADRGVLTGDVPLLLPPERTVIEIIETVALDDEVVEGILRLVQSGYRIALDDFRWGTGHEHLLPLASFVKIDLLVSDIAEQQVLAEKLADYDVTLVGEKIEDLADMPRLRDLGYELFQGYALDRPEIVEGRTLTSDTAGRVTSAVDLLGGDADFDHFEKVLRRDPALAHQIMQLASLGRMGETRRALTTIRDALVMSGTRRIRNWIALLLARPGGGGAAARDAFLTTLVRARACELLAPARGIDPSVAFTAGMLSSLDGLLQVSQDELVAKLALSDELREAAFGDTSPTARLVRSVVEYQAHAGTSGLVVAGTTDTDAAVDLVNAVAAAFAWGVEAVAVLD